MRHAKSSWDNSSLSDFERPLNDRGMEAAPKMGRVLEELSDEPDKVISSPANRAKQTAELVKKAGGFSVEIDFDPRIYGASVSELLEVVSEIGDNFETALLFGHNPGFENLVRVLTGELETMPTAALAWIELDIDNWNETLPDCGTLVELIRPKDLN